MKEVELIKQLRALGEIKPSPESKEERRALLLSQIGAEANEKAVSPVLSGIKIPFIALRYMPQSMMAVFLMALLLAGGATGLWASRDAKPGDSLYMAKIASEKTQFALTFNEKKKVRLGLAFAGNRAEEIKQILAENGNIDKKEARVEKLVFNYRREINNAKDTLERISELSLETVAEEEEQVEETALEEAIIEDDAEAIEEDPGLEVDEELVFSAGSEKDKNGLEVSETVSPGTKSSLSAADSEILSDPAGDVGSSSDIENINSSTADIIIEDELIEPETILEQADKLLQEDEYKEALDMLGQAEDLISEALEGGEVRGVEEGAATSTDMAEENIDVEAEEENASSSEVGE